MGHLCDQAGEGDCSLGEEADVGAPAASVSSVPCMGQGQGGSPEVWLFSWSCRKENYCLLSMCYVPGSAVGAFNALSPFSPMTTRDKGRLVFYPFVQQKTVC